ncbi:MAG: serine hydrolase [Clostridia bacterium]|nr:serine hydrolase [Bacilli bacterium]MBR3324893.1 serine hydrolase [Clostridia bacterium]MBR4618722.1 serine hydrolase [Bacilli bacterium]
MENIIDNLDSIIKYSGENVSAIIKDINSQEYIYKFNSDTKLISASTIKVPIMLAILEEVRQGNISLDAELLVKSEDVTYNTKVFENGEKRYSIYELINWMIINSDNTATNVLIRKIGMDKINSYILNELKVKSTSLQRYMLDFEAVKEGLNNYMSQEDMLIIFTKLFNKKILNDDLCEKAVNILYNQRGQYRIMRYIYEPVKFAHKGGALDYLGHDVGVMNINDKLYYVGISVYDSKDKEGNNRLFGNLGREIYEYLKNIKKQGVPVYKNKGY